MSEIRADGMYLVCKMMAGFGLVISDEASRSLECPFLPQKVLLGCCCLISVR